MTLRSALIRVAERSEKELLSLHGSFRSGRITEATFIALAAAAIARANARAVAVADLGIAAAILQATGESVGPVGVVLESDQRRLRDAVRSILTAEIASVDTETDLQESTAARLGRIGRAEPLSMAQTAMLTAMASQGVEGWTRQTGPDPCPLCVSWADGKVRPPTTRMARHHNCSCVARPA